MRSTCRLQLRATILKKGEETTDLRSGVAGYDNNGPLLQHLILKK